MLRKRDITTGKFYVNNGRKVARKILRSNGQTIIFNTYHLDTGFSCGSPSECTMQDFTRWADREASSTEIASVQNQEQEDYFYAPQPFN